MQNKIKVFHGLVNYGTQAGLLAEALRERGITSISVSQPDRFSRMIDVELLHGGSLFIKITRHSWNWMRRIGWFFKYNTFHFYYGTSLFPAHLDFRLYKIFGKVVVCHYLGKDVKLYRETIEKYRISNMAYSCGDHDAALRKDEVIKRRLKLESKYADKQLVCSPVYSEFVDGADFIPLAIDLSPYEFRPLPMQDVVKIMHAPTCRLNKGTAFIIEAVEKLQAEGFCIELMLCEDISHDELREKYYECDIFIDQVLGGYGTAAIEAMACGRPTISYLRTALFSDELFVGGIPIIRANGDTIHQVLKETLLNKTDLPQIGVDSRRFVELNHDVVAFAERLEKMYEQLHSNS
jgi:hypothetical protein